MQILSQALTKFLVWLEHQKTQTKPDDYEPYEHTDLEPPPYYAPMLGRGAQR